MCIKTTHSHTQSHTQAHRLRLTPKQTHTRTHTLAQKQRKALKIYDILVLFLWPAAVGVDMRYALDWPTGVRRVECGEGGMKICSSSSTCMCACVCASVVGSVCALSIQSNASYINGQRQRRLPSTCVWKRRRERDMCVCVWLGSVLRCVYARATCVCLSVCRCCPIGAQKPFCQQQQQ